MNQARKLLLKSDRKQICESCGVENMYNGKPIVLHVDHINGNKHDNTLTNLRYLCPNCHSQTETWCGKNNSMKKNRVMEELWDSLTDEEIMLKIANKTGDTLSLELNVSYTVIWKYLKKRGIKKPAVIYRKAANRPTKDELIQLITQLPFTNIGRMYGVSDNAVRKWCRTYQIDLSTAFLKNNPDRRGVKV